MKLRHFSVLGNYYPWNNGFHFAGGLVLNGTKVTADAKPTDAGSYTFGDKTYTSADIASADAKIDFRNIAPYVGIGWDNGNQGGAGWSVAASAGAMFTGSPDVTFNANCTDAAKSAGLCDEIQRSAEDERRELEDDVDEFKVYPVISLGAMYKF